METLSVHEALEREAAAANAALDGLTDERVAHALGEAARLASVRRPEILAANEADLEAAEGRLDAGALDRLRLHEARPGGIAQPPQGMGARPPPRREIAPRAPPRGPRGGERP